MQDLLAQVPPSFLVFVPIAAFTVAGAAGVAFSRNIVYSAFSLLATFVGMVGLFACLSADFLAAVQLMVYVGGILVLILFAVMLTNKISEVKGSNPSSHLWLGGLVLIGLVGLLSLTVVSFPWADHGAAAYAPTTELIGNALLGPYLLPFEVAGLLLLAALLAAVVVARKEVKESVTAAAGEERITP
ncbi:MAG: NADH-quinone oxidoreductase subunit J [Deltaproteobacteria bacterium]|nr:NADH-quinone oxidoreductase subunit J [Deltaproteobacteria bacterium]